MSTVDEYISDGNTASDAGRDREAALFYERAAEAARELGDTERWFKCLFFAANSWRTGGEPHRAMNKLLDLRMSEGDGPLLDRWFCRVEYFLTVLSTQPALDRLRELLQELAAFAEEYPVPRNDMLLAEGILLEWRGDIDGALTHYEAAWQQHNGKGYQKWALAEYAARVSLKLGKLSVARDWIRALGTQGGRHGGGRFDEAYSGLCLSLYECEPISRLRKRLRRVADAAIDLQGVGRLFREADASIRVHLLDQALGDPLRPAHPARQQWMQGALATPFVANRLWRKLLLLDYRLAALRFAAGVAPVDDLYHKRPQAVPKSPEPSDREDFRRRLKKAWAAYFAAWSYAQALDDKLECDWRQREVYRRGACIREIAVAADEPAPALEEPRAVKPTTTET